MYSFVYSALFSFWKDTGEAQTLALYKSPLLIFRHGGWIFDTFPSTRDQWTSYIEKAHEKNILADDVICLQDPSDNGDFLIKRWYFHNRSEVDARIEQRKQKEAEDKRQREEAER